VSHTKLSNLNDDARELSHSYYTHVKRLPEIDDHTMTGSHTGSTKRRKGDQSTGSTCTNNTEKGFDQTSIDAGAAPEPKLPDPTSTAFTTGQGTLLSSLSTSPINDDDMA
jgi:hypothetical protein